MLSQVLENTSKPKGRSSNKILGKIYIDNSTRYYQYSSMPQWSMFVIVDVSHIPRIWLPMQTAKTYLKSARFTGANNTNNIDILQKLVILEPFYGIRNILDSMCEIADADVFSYIFRTWLPIQTANTYLESARLTGSNTKIETL